MIPPLAGANRYLNSRIERRQSQHDARAVVAVEG
jgi:hypothetical protein